MAGGTLILPYLLLPTTYVERVERVEHAEEKRRHALFAFCLLFVLACPRRGRAQRSSSTTADALRYIYYAVDHASSVISHQSSVINLLLLIGC